MTEEEAKTKWCHRTISPIDYSSLRLKGAHCAGSACMAWRWSDIAEASVDVRPGPHPSIRPPAVEGHTWRPQDRKKGLITTWSLHPKLGYCGLIGEP